MLTDTTIRNAKPGEKPRRLFDVGGLYLEVAPAGGKGWRLKYRFAGKEKRISLGVYPAVGLREARARRDGARKQLATSIDPSAARKAEKAAEADSFAVVAREWYAKHAPRWGLGHADNTIRCLERDVFPWLGTRPMGKVTAPELLACLRRIEARGALETAHRVLQNCGRIFRYARPPAAPSAIRRPISAARYRRLRKRTTRPSRTPRPSVPCCASSTATGAICRPVAP